MFQDRAGPTREQMHLLALKAVAGLPEPFRGLLDGVILDVEDFATPEQLAAVGLEDRWELSGLYEGESLPDRSQWHSGTMPSRIWLFRRPLIAEWRETGVEMEALIRHVVIHEAGHHFGLSDEDMHALEDDAD